MSTTNLVKTERGSISVPIYEFNDFLGIKEALKVEKCSALKTKVGAVVKSYATPSLIGHNREANGGIVHAEIDALVMYLKLKEYGLIEPKAGIPCTMYITWIPCFDCAKAIIAAGIKRVVGINRLLPIEKQAEYNTKYKLNEALELLRGSGVEVTLYDEQSGWMQSESVAVLTPKSND